jgi:hypothetical protein
MFATNAPVAGEALQRIGQLFDVERAAMGLAAATALTRSPGLRASHRRWPGLVSRYLTRDDLRLGELAGAIPQLTSK